MEGMRGEGVQTVDFESALDLVVLVRWMEGHLGSGQLEAQKRVGPMFELGSITQRASEAYRLSEF